MKSETKLKPCPFCGSEGIVVETHRDHWHVECVKCAARVFPPHLSKMSAVGAWNERKEENMAAMPNEKS